MAYVALSEPIELRSGRMGSSTFWTSILKSWLPRDSLTRPRLPTRVPWLQDIDSLPS